MSAVHGSIFWIFDRCLFNPSISSENPTDLGRRYLSPLSWCAFLWLFFSVRIQSKSCGNLKSLCYFGFTGNDSSVRRLKIEILEPSAYSTLFTVEFKKFWVVNFRHVCCLWLNNVSEVYRFYQYMSPTANPKWEMTTWMGAKMGAWSGLSFS